MDPRPCADESDGSGGTRDRAGAGCEGPGGNGGGLGPNAPISATCGRNAATRKNDSAVWVGRATVPHSRRDGTLRADSRVNLNGRVGVPRRSKCVFHHTAEAATTLHDATIKKGAAS
jgi:hypothetical protein